MLKVGDWIGELTTTVGTGTITLGGALQGFAKFSDLGDGNTVWYAIVDGNNRESGIGLITGGTLERTTPHSSLVNGVYSDNGVSPINLSGSANVYCTFNSVAFLEFIKTTGATMTGVFELADGSESLPSGTFANDLTSGFYLSAPDDIRLTLSGADLMRFNSGIVSIWATAWKQIATSDQILNWARLDAAQSFTGIQTFTQSLVINGDDGWVAEDTGLRLGDNVGNVDYSGFEYVSATDSLDLSLNGLNDTFRILDGTTLAFTFTGSTGTLLATGNLSAYSDKRLKTNIKPILDSLDKCRKLTGYNYTRTDLGIRQDGILAQDVVKVLPNSVDMDKEGILSVAHNGIIALLVNCVNELHDRICELEKNNDSAS